MKTVFRAAACWAVLLLLAAPAAHAQLGQWTAHTSFREITDLAASDAAVWAATTGGVFRYDVEAGDISRYTITEGLFNIEAAALAYDAGCDGGGCVWIGYRDGVLDRLRLADGTVRTFRDIARAERYGSREIHRLAVTGDTVLVATAFGLVVFDPVRGEVRDSYDQLGDLPSATAVYDVTVAPLPDGQPGLWLATDGGIAYAPLAATNLKDPSTWTVERGLAGNPRVIGMLGGRIYVGTTGALLVREADGTYRNLGVTSFAVQAFSATADRLYAADPFNLFIVGADGQVGSVTVPGYDALSDVLVGPRGQLWLGDQAEGLVEANPPATAGGTLEVLRAFYPEGPYDTRFADLAVTDDGTLWAGGVTNIGAGFYRRTPNGDWTSFTRRTVPTLGSDYTRVHVDPSGNAWAAGQGNGLVQVTPEGEVRVYGRQNSTLRTVPGVQNEDFILVGGAGSDAQGNLWVTNRGAAISLHVRTPEGTWRALQLPASCAGDRLSVAAATLDWIYVDAFGQKWIRVVSRSSLNTGLGLLVLDTGATPTETADDVCRFFGPSERNGEGLPGAEVFALAEDHDGTIWIGTNEGPDPNTVPLWPQLASFVPGENPYVLRGVSVSALAVDPANRLWMGTSDAGLRLIEADGGAYEEVLRFEAASSPLISDVTLALAVDAQSGEVYVSTGAGLVSYGGDAVAPVQEPQDLFVYPNPVRMQEGAMPEVFIEGLVEATEVVIMAPHGAVVQRFAARGGRARWDGRDQSGRPVPSGMYLVVAVGQNGEDAAYGKVAVIR